MILSTSSSTRHGHTSPTRDASKRHTTSHMLLLRRHIIAKVYINVVFINITVNTSLSTRQQDGHLQCPLIDFFCKTHHQRRQDHVTTTTSLHRHGITLVTT